MRQLRPHEHCLNCGAAVATRFCAECGQENTDYRVSLGHLVGDLADEVFQLESRLWRTLWTLFRRPGLLTVEYNAGRRVRYTTPLRLYLLASVTYFFVGGVLPAHHDQVRVDFGTQKEIESEMHVVSNGWQHRVLERVKAYAADPNGASVRVRAILAEWVPRVMAVLVPSFALLLMLFFRRPRRFYVEHLVFALHLHAAAFFLLTIAETVPHSAFFVTVALIVVYAKSARRVYAQSWWRLLWKLPLISQAYSILVGLTVAGVLAVGLFS